MKSCGLFLSLLWGAAIFVPGIEAVAPGVNPVYDPFYLIPVTASKNGQSTIHGECIGILITYNHVLAPSECLKLEGKMATGVFMDYRDDKTYPSDPNVFPVASFAFSKRILTKDKLAILELAIPFNLMVSNSPIRPAKIGSSSLYGTLKSLERNGEKVKMNDAKAIFSGKDEVNPTGGKIKMNAFYLTNDAKGSYKYKGFVDTVDNDLKGKLRVFTKEDCAWIAEKIDADSSDICAL